MRPGDLPELARELARRETGRPESVSLRRAVSNAYYALFHALGTLCAASLVGAKVGRHRVVIYRSLDHRKTLDSLRASGPSMAAVARSFKTLQDRRHEADYSPEPFSSNRGDTLDLIEISAQAIAGLEVLTPDDKLALAVRPVVKPR